MNKYKGKRLQRFISVCKQKKILYLFDALVSFLYLDVLKEVRMSDFACLNIYSLIWTLHAQIKHYKF